MGSLQYPGSCSGEIHKSPGNESIVVSSVDIFPIRPRSGLVGFATVTINHALALSEIAVHTTLDGEIRIKFPMRILPTGVKSHCIQPLNDVTHELIRSAVQQAYESLLSAHMKNRNDEEGSGNG